MITELSINGRPYSVDLARLSSDTTLNTFIRDHAGLSATKFMCQEGGCGACVCVVTSTDPATGAKRTRAVNSCLTLLNSCVGSAVTTCEGIGNKRDGYHPIQERLAKMNGTQCGYCSPGIVMNMYGLLSERQGKVTMQEVEDAFGGNICRCTGYRPILEAMKSFATDSNIQVPAECRDIEDLSSLTCPKTGLSCSGSCKSAPAPPAHLQNASGEQWFWPKTLSEAVTVLAQLADDNFMLVAGNTAHGVYRRSFAIDKFVDVNLVPDLHQHKVSADALELGANLSISDTMHILRQVADTPGFEYCSKVWEHFDLVANVPIRNMGTLAGNVAIKRDHPDFPSDICVVFEALDVQVVVLTPGGAEEKRPLSEFLRSGARRALMKSFVLRAYSKDKYLFDSFKIMQRAQNAHAYVNAAFFVQLRQPGTIVESARICYGGLSGARASQAEQLLVGRDLFHRDSVAATLDCLARELRAEAVLPEPSPQYKLKLACGLYYKFVLKNAPADRLLSRFESGGQVLRRPVSTSKQTFEASERCGPVHTPTEKHEGLLQCSGESMFANDVRPLNQQLWAAIFTAKKIGARVTRVDSTEALKLPGVVAVFTAKDIPGCNRIAVTDNMFFMEDQSLFVEGETKYLGQPVGMVVAESNSLASRAAELIRLEYEGEASQVFPTLQAALEARPAGKVQHTVKSAASEAGTSKKAVDLEPFDKMGKGALDMGLQYHFFMEPQTTVAVPGEGGMQLYVSTQWMDLTQTVVAQFLGIKNNEVQIKTTRIGGGYGGKATGSLPASCAAALAAYKLNRPVRFVQSLESMMESLGKRWACHVDYEFYAKNSGKIVHLDSSFYEDAGCSPNESPMGHTVLLSKNCYQFTSDNFMLDGYMVLTDSPSNTACRAPGSVEAIAMIENIMEHVAFELGVDPLEVRRANLISGHKMCEMMPHFLESTQYAERRRAVAEFNKANRWTKRGLGLAVMEYHMGYFGQFPATVAIYHGDGTVVISHGGVEMGQGMNTKVVQVAAHMLGIPMQLIRVEASNTIDGANSMVTGGSIGSESVCYAVRKCCQTLLDRLAPARESLKDAPWAEVVSKAHGDNINLIASDGYKAGEMDPYTVCGLGLTEVEMDVLTGNYIVSRVDILQDAGESLNPNVDIGQVEGAFIMGLGYWTTELFVTDQATGQIRTNRSWNYKPPGAKDIPVDFRIELLAQSRNQAGFMRSKASGEPSICLAVNVSFALQQAIQSARDDAGLPKKWITLKAPMSPEHVLLSCGAEVQMMQLTDAA